MFENLNLGSLMKDAEDMKKEMEKIEVTGESGAGAITVTMTAKHYVKNISISDDIISEDKVVLEELICGAINDAVKRIEDATKDKFMGMSSAFSSMIPPESNDKKE
jgi:nucleoid-associated protein EbfC